MSDGFPRKWPNSYLRLFRSFPSTPPKKRNRKININLKTRFEDYTEREYIELVSILFDGSYSSEDEHDSIFEIIISTSEHPSASDVLCHPEDGVEDSPFGVVTVFKEWRAANGKPGFKPEK